MRNDSAAPGAGGKPETQHVNYNTNDSHLNITVSRSIGGYANTDLTETKTDFKSFCCELSNPKIGVKDGSYFIRCGGTERSNKGTSDTANLLILDGDSSIDENGEDIPGAPDPEKVSQALADLGLSHCIYTSFSNDDGLNKYRVIFPCTYSPEQLPALLDYCFSRLHDAGVMLYPVNENRTWSQPWYFPRVPDHERLKLFKTYAHSGTLLDVESIHQDWLKKQPQRQEPKPLERKEHTFKPGQLSPIDEFNKLYSCGEILTKNNYLFKNGRYLRPDSESKIPGVQICLNCKDGIERIFSHGNDSLNDNYAHDAFDIFRLLECKGDFGQALKWNADITKQNQIEWAKAQDSQITTGKDYPLNIVYADELSDKYEAPDEIIQDVFTSVAGSIIYGDSNSGKTFLAIDMACSIARGVEWMGRKTEPGLVVYLAAESPQSIVSRLQVYQKYHGTKVPNFCIVKNPIDLFGDDVDTNKIIDLVRIVEAERQQKAIFIVGDTLARLSAGANENAGADMGLVIRRFDHIRDECKAHFCLIHHSGKNAANGARGWSGVRAAVDTEIEITEGCIEITKQRDLASKGERIGFSLEPVQMGLSKFGKPVTSCIVKNNDAPSKQETRKSEAAGAILELLNNVSAGMMKKEIVHYFSDRYHSSNVYRQLSALKKLGQVIENKGIYSLVQIGAN